MSAVTKTANSSDTREHFGAYVCDDESAKMLAEVITEYGWSPERVQTGGIANAVRSLAVMRSPEFLIVDLSDSLDPRSDINALAEVCEPGTIVLAIGAMNDVALYRDLLNSGLQDYLVKPLTSDVLHDAIAMAEQALKAPSPGEEEKPEEHKMIAVLGVRGGVGASTIAASCAYIAAEEMRRKVALLDLDIHFGTDALVFDLEPGRGLVDALENPSRVDGLFIDRATVKATDRLAILGAEAPMTDPIVPDPTSLQHLETELRNNFEVVVIDVPRNIAVAYAPILAQVNRIMVVCELTLAATRDTIRLLSFLKTVAPEAKISLIANKVATAGQLEVNAKDFAASVEHEIDFSIPLDVKTMVAAAQKGKSLPQAMPKSKPVSVLREITEASVGKAKDQSAQKKPFWAQLTGKK